MTRIAVVGIGSIGSQVIYQLAKAGAEVVGYESFTPGHDRGAGAGDTRIFRSAHFEDSRWVPLLSRADVLWDELSAESGKELRHLTGCVLMGPKSHGQMATVIQSVADHNLDVEVMEAEELNARFPQFRGVEGDVAILDRRAGSIRPELAIMTAASLAQGLGATIHKKTKVLDIVETADGVTIHSTSGRESFDQVVITAGPWINQLLPELAETITIKRPVSVWFPRKDLDQAWDPTFIRTGPRHFYAVPSPDGLTVKIGLSVTDHETVHDPDDVNRNITLKDLEPFVEMAEKYLPGVIPDPVRVTPYLEGYVADSRPIVRTSQGDRKITVMAGFSGHGFKLAPAFGEIGAELALTGQSQLPIDFLAR